MTIDLTAEAVLARTLAPFAHSLPGRAESDWQGLLDHLEAVAGRAKALAARFGGGELAYLAGLLHDFGKFADAYQLYIRDRAKSPDHSTAGARLAVERWKEAGQHWSKSGWILASIIAGHHSGLPNGSGMDASLETRLDVSRRTILDAKAGLAVLGDRLPAALPALPFEHWPTSRSQGLATPAFRLHSLIRMIFSCLVDADFLDTEAFYAQAEGKVGRRADFLPLPALKSALDAHLAGFAGAAGPVNAIRAEILAAARAAAGQAPGLFSLTVPTGGGKTLASLAFALDHALAHGLDRVIYVIPFTSIIEQTAGVFRRAFGDAGAVVEHHSGFDAMRLAADQGEPAENFAKLRLAAENWDAPVIVTTAVQFFESLFANRPSACRKLHSIARSVVVLDEAQSLPFHLLRPCLAALETLAGDYGSSVLLCTATQPGVTAGEGFRQGLAGVREIAPDPAGLARRLKRVALDAIEPMLVTPASLANALRGHERALCIVGTRRDARDVFDALGDAPGHFHLSALMCPAHRSAVLAQIRSVLASGGVCRVVATSLVEAGVDIDFPVVLRAMAGLDALTQAAGRANREGRLDPGPGRLILFRMADPKDEAAPRPLPKDLEQRARIAALAMAAHPDDPLGPAAVAHYFRILYVFNDDAQDSALDTQGILKRINERLVPRASEFPRFPFADIAHDVQLIDSVQQPVIVPYGEGITLLADLRVAEELGNLPRRLQSYIVTLPPPLIQQLEAAGAIEFIQPHRFGEQFRAVIDADRYDMRYGLNVDESRLRSSLANMI